MLTVAGCAAAAVAAAAFLGSRQSNTTAVQDTLHSVDEAVAAFETLTDGSCYAADSMYQQWVTRHSKADKTRPLTARSIALRSRLETFRRYRENGRRLVTEANNRFIEREVTRYRNLFDSVESDPLTRAQASAVVHDEDNHLVVAGAGSGKTSLIVAKVAYLLTSGKAKPHEILVLAFNSDAAEELAKRIITKIDGADDVQVSTFHSYGLSVIGKATDRKPSLSKVADPDYKKRNAKHVIEDALKAMMEDPAIAARILTFFAFELHPAPPDLAEISQAAYNRQVRDLPDTLRGEKVKSHGEHRIANWLYLNGIKYDYEADHEHDSATSTHRQYKPDFTVHRSDGTRIYVEYFGVDKKGRTAPNVNATEYKQSTQWKRNFHKTNGTILIETFFYDLTEEKLEERLQQKLSDAGVTPQPLDPTEVLKDLGGEPVTVLSTLFATFLSLFKSNMWTIKELEARTVNRSDKSRCDVFLELFDPIYDAYQQEIKGASGYDIDFADMVTRACPYLEGGEITEPFRYVIVDEYQDVAKGRARILGAVKQNSGAKLICVGDDWQSIYRFTGSDLTYMTDFAKQYGYSIQSELDQTFRFHQPLVDATSLFITRNPIQITKTINAAPSTEKPIEIVGHPRDATNETINNTLKTISKRHAPDDKITVMVLGRYNFQIDDLRYTNPPNITVTRSTVHSSKGTQADYVIIIGVNRGAKYSFPSKISDDPVIDLVLTQSDNYPHGEERRLFYVATTRTKNINYILCDEDNPSPFLEEITTPDYTQWVNHNFTRPQCVSCGAGRIKTLKSTYKNGGVYHRCTNTDRCRTKLRTCVNCSSPMQAINRTWTCSSPACGHQSTQCPKCEHGYIKTKNYDNRTFHHCNKGKHCGYNQTIWKQPKPAKRRRHASHRRPPRHY